jgi:hypothetical protein
VELFIANAALRLSYAFIQNHALNVWKLHSGGALKRAKSDVSQLG